MQVDQTVSQMAQEIIVRQAKALARRSGCSLEEAKEAVSDTKAGMQLRDLANGVHRNEKAQAWQASVFWGRRGAIYAPNRFGASLALGGQTPLYWRQGTYIEGGRKASRSERAGARMPERMPSR